MQNLYVRKPQSIEPKFLSELFSIYHSSTFFHKTFVWKQIFTRIGLDYAGKSASVWIFMSYGTWKNIQDHPTPSQSQA